eukprot:CAMPEP_0175978446 /NCGR_PEP_ID=MMETSP0108-20121206/45647_1 /TAXON_ID=195067 ORGANISM="Goniomonas pacifica, Strain CCMP1869" /NCGR_SAMPLE_ID=MMETSP0108 /ASSEMBLY_ACC=CAM_ASM_000204 /LENGTH=68 /DNA_ID=CAMNT_0017308591 /DNA_START=96 /DNA_END=299 /DNA_ORIENTATION=+
MTLKCDQIAMQPVPSHQTYGFERSQSSRKQTSKKEQEHTENGLQKALSRLQEQEQFPGMLLENFEMWL